MDIAFDLAADNAGHAAVFAAVVDWLELRRGAVNEPADVAREKNDELA